MESELRDSAKRVQDFLLARGFSFIPLTAPGATAPGFSRAANINDLPYHDNRISPFEKGGLRGI